MLLCGKIFHDLYIMKKSSLIVLSLIATVITGGLLPACTSSSGQAAASCAIRIEHISGFPDYEPGYSLGVSACYAGFINDDLIIAGGCNFPGIPASEGGEKRFYKGIYRGLPANDSTLTWTQIGELPVEAAYGVTLSLPHKLIFVGGNHSAGGLSTTYSLSLNATGDAAILDTLPALPFALDNMAGAVLGNVLYVFGGNKAGVPSASLFSLSMENPAEGWKEEPVLPGAPRVQPVCTAQEDALYIWGGFSPSLGENQEATVATDGYRYLPASKTWEPVSAPVVPATGELLTLTGGASVACSDSLILCVGGVNKEIFLDAISGSYSRVTKENYLTQPVSWYRFNNRLMVYDIHRNGWDEWGQSSGLARAGAALAGRQQEVFVIGGETKPGIRTAQICKIVIE